jgi:peptide/nickel transport system permease protein
MVGARFTLLVSGSTVLLATAVSIILGLVCGYVGGLLDEIVMRVIDAINSFPSILIALVMVSILNYGKLTIIPALVIMFIPSFTRIVRTGTLQYKNAEFVLSNKVFGDSDLRILFVHILPNIYPLLLSSIVIGLSNAILAESSMSYLGLGIQPPIPSWGRMLKEAQDIIFSTPWAAIAPGIMLTQPQLRRHHIQRQIHYRSHSPVYLRAEFLFTQPIAITRNRPLHRWNGRQIPYTQLHT